MLPNETLHQHETPNRGFSFDHWFRCHSSCSIHHPSSISDYPSSIIIMNVIIIITIIIIIIIDRSPTQNLQNTLVLLMGPIILRGHQSKTFKNHRLFIHSERSPRQNLQKPMVLLTGPITHTSGEAKNHWFLIHFEGSPSQNFQKTLIFVVFWARYTNCRIGGTMTGSFTKIVRTPTERLCLGKHSQIPSATFLLYSQELLD